MSESVSDSAVSSSKESSSPASGIKHVDLEQESSPIINRPVYITPTKEEQKHGRGSSFSKM